MMSSIQQRMIESRIRREREQMMAAANEQHQKRLEEAKKLESQRVLASEHSRR